MATPKTDRKPGAAGRHKAARPIQSRQVGKRAPQSKRVKHEPPMPTRDEAPMATRRPVNIADEPLLTRSDRPRDADSLSDDDGFGGGER
jgi:hypothetical protein